MDTVCWYASGRSQEMRSRFHRDLYIRRSTGWSTTLSSPPNGAEREQPPGEVLHVNSRGASPPARRNGRLEPASVCDCRGLEYDVGGGVTCSSACVLCFVCSLGGVNLKTV